MSRVGAGLGTLLNHGRVLFYAQRSILHINRLPFKVKRRWYNIISLDASVAESDLGNRSVEAGSFSNFQHYSSHRQRQRLVSKVSRLSELFDTPNKSKLLQYCGSTVVCNIATGSRPGALGVM